MKQITAIDMAEALEEHDTEGATGEYTIDNIIDGPCLQVVDEFGTPKLTVLIHHGGDMIHRIAGIASQIDASRGK